MRYELTDHEWAAIRLMLPNKPRGVPRVNDRRFLMASSGSCDLAHYGVIFQATLVRTRPATIASFGGVRGRVGQAHERIGGFP